MDENEIKNIVIQGYRSILKRDPDPGGLSNYIDEIKKGLKIERFYHVLRTSEEYKQKFGQQHHVDLSSLSSQNTPNIITYCMIGGNKLHEIKDYIPTTLPYIDRFIYVDSGSTDGTLEFLKDLSLNNNKIDIIVKEWQDKFSYFRNFYLEHLRNKNYNGFVLTSDTDEYFPPETLSQLKDLMSNKSYSGIQFRAYDIIIDDNDRTKIISQSLSNYWKGLMFKFHQNLRYEGEPHETLVGEQINWKQTDLIYKHVRSQRKIYERAVENFFISNSNRYSPKWSEFRILCSKNGMTKFSDFFEMYKEGDLPKDVEDWINNHRDDSQDSGDSEVREMAKLYYEILHPEKKR